MYCDVNKETTENLFRERLSELLQGISYAIASVWSAQPQRAHDITWTGTLDKTCLSISSTKQDNMSCRDRCV